MADLTAEQKKARLATLRVWYETVFGKGGNVPKKLKDAFLKDKGAWDFERAKMWIRRNDPHWLQHPDARDRVAMLRDLYRNSFGATFNHNTKEFRKQAQAFARGNPRLNKNEVLRRIFKTHILNSKAFAKTIPGGRDTFMSWLKQQGPGTDIIKSVADFANARQAFEDAWGDAETGAKIPADLLAEALTNNWRADGPEFTKAIVNSVEYSGTRPYQDKVADFNEKWTTMFGEDYPPPEDLAAKYAKSTTNWEKFLRSDIEKTDQFKAAFPDYSEWKAREVQSGVPEDDIDIYAYFTDRQDFIEVWQRAYTDGQPVDAELLATAMRENWSIPQWQNKLKQLPNYATTAEGKNKSEQFNLYWRSMFGESSPVNTELRGKFVSGNLSDPSGMWEDIKQTQGFRDVYRDWDAFANAQSRVGNNVVSDPMMYNEYKTGFQKAFADMGMDVPDGLERSIFASGEDVQDIQRNVAMTQAAQKSYQLQTGKTADVATAIGAKDKVAGGNLRVRLQKALEAQKAYNQSTIKPIEQDRQQATGFVTQKI